MGHEIILNSVHLNVHLNVQWISHEKINNVCNLSNDQVTHDTTAIHCCANYSYSVIWSGVRWFRTSTISDWWFGRQSVISDGVRWNRTVISDGVRLIWTPRWILTVISDGVRWIRMPNSVVFYLTILELLSLLPDGNFGRWFRTLILDGVMFKKT